MTWIGAGVVAVGIALILSGVRSSRAFRRRLRALDPELADRLERCPLRYVLLDSRGTPICGWDDEAAARAMLPTARGLRLVDQQTGLDLALFATRSGPGHYAYPGEIVRSPYSYPPE